MAGAAAAPPPSPPGAAPAQCSAPTSAAPAPPGAPHACATAGAPGPGRGPRAKATPAGRRKLTQSMRLLGATSRTCATRAASSSGPPSAASTRRSTSARPGRACHATRQRGRASRAARLHGRASHAACWRSRASYTAGTVQGAPWSARPRCLLPRNSTLHALAGPYGVPHSRRRSTATGMGPGLPKSVPMSKDQTCMCALSPAQRCAKRSACVAAPDSGHGNQARAACAPPRTAGRPGAPGSNSSPRAKV